MRTIHRRKYETYVQQGPQIAIFDIGTRAIRVLVGPKENIPSDWDSQIFFNSSVLTDLGGDIDSKNRLLPQSRGLQKIISFMNDFIAAFQRDDVEVYAFGTAIFRWIENATDVITYVERMTGVRIQILSQKQEAYMSCLALCATRHILNPQPDAKNNNHLLLIDQGGGSTEISVLHIDDTGFLEHVQLHSFDDLGSIALRDRFLNVGTQQQSQNSQKHFEELQNLIADKIQNWYDRQSNNPDGVKRIKNTALLCYGMGSALSNMFEDHNYVAHNQSVPIEKLQQHITQAKNDLLKDNLEMGEFQRQFEEMDTSTKKRFLYACALNVHQNTLRVFGLQHIRMCGYGLRYGIFAYFVLFSEHHQNIDPELQI